MIKKLIQFFVPLLAVAPLGNLVAGGASTKLADEYVVKAAFLYNFAKFVEWPAASFQGPTDPMSICVLGLDPFGRMLDDVASGKSIDGHPLVVRTISNARQAAGCRILFVGACDRKRLSGILTDIKETGILTVGDTDVAGADGPVINFIVDAGKVRFEINVEAAERQKLRVSSKLLSLARPPKR